MTTGSNENSGFKYFTGGGEMSDCMRSFDWTQSELGPVTNWPLSLLSTLGICLSARFPMAIYWGEKGFLLYNDAWRPILGDKHPWALGREARSVWPEIWETINPLFEKVRRTGEGTWRGDELLPMQRFGYTEECYFDYSFNPITGPGGKVEGILNIVQETTFRVLSERRNQLLGTLAVNLGQAKTEKSAGELAISTLASDAADIPFALLFLAESDGKNIQLIATTGLGPENQNKLSGSTFLGELAKQSGPLDSKETVGKSVMIEGLTAAFGKIPAGHWPEPIEKALVFPIGAMETGDRLAILVVGVSPRRQLDADYTRFFELVASHVSSALRNARAYEGERRRAEALSELDRAKTTFFSNVSHEFRTPLTLMLGPLDELLVRRKQSSIPQDTADLEVIYRNSLRLLKLVNTLLDFSRMEAGHQRPVCIKTDLTSLTTSLASMFRPAIEKAGLKLTIDCTVLRQPVFVDRDMWEKIVFNLLSNALKFTLSGVITILLSEEDGFAILSVRDTGIGIPVKELPNVFKRFHRVENARGRSHEGTGIGLALVSELVKYHGGNIEVRSEYGQGTVFTVRIPLGDQHLDQENMGSALAEGQQTLRGTIFLEEVASWLPTQASAMVNEADFRELETNAGAKEHIPCRLRILLAEDNADMRHYICRLLNKRYDVEAVGDGAAALDAARRSRPNLVISDLMMPCLDGFGLLRELRSDPATKDIPVILLSARAGEDAVVEGVETGADDYLTKPFSAQELLTRVASQLAMARVRKVSADQIQQSEERYHHLFNSLLEGFCIIEMVFDEKGKPVDYCFIEINPAFEQQTGLHNAKGKMIRELVPNHDAHWFEIFGRIALTGEPAQFESEAKALNRWFKVSAFRVGGTGSRSVAILFNDITERTEKAATMQKLYALLEDKSAHLEVLVQQRTAKLMETIGELEAFSYSIAHDMRAPLRSLQGFAGILLEDYGSKIDDACRHYLGLIARSANRMDQLIQDVLNYSRVVREDFPMTSINLEKMLTGIVDTYPNLGTSEADIVLQGSFPFVMGNEAMLTQIFSNIMGNGVKFVSAGVKPRLTLWAELRTGFVRVFVQDNGIGISADHHERIFRMFQRVSKNHEGTGIGLAIVKKAVDRIGGKVGLQSEPGRGSIFWIDLQRELNEEALK